MLRVSRFIAIAIFLMLVRLTGVAAAAVFDASGQPEGAAAPTPSAPADRTSSWLHEFFRLDDKTWAVGADYFTTTESNRNNIDVELLEAARVWHFAGGLELQARGGLFHAGGSRSRSDVFLANLPSGDSTTTGITAGGVARFYPVNLNATHLFVEGSAQFLYTPGDQFPAGGTEVNALLGATAGVSYDISSELTLELAYGRAHVSNGGGLNPRNPIWNGQGGHLALRHRF